MSIFPSICLTNFSVSLFNWINISPLNLYDIWPVHMCIGWCCSLTNCCFICYPSVHPSVCISVFTCASRYVCATGWMSGWISVCKTIRQRDWVKKFKMLDVCFHFEVRKSIFCIGEQEARAVTLKIKSFKSTSRANAVKLFVAIFMNVCNKQKSLFLAGPSSPF